jgi:hypothetical protein
VSQIETKVLASVLYQLRILLGTVAGPNASHEVQLAWHLTYALHNDALAAIEVNGFDVEGALARIAHIDQIIGGNDGEKIANQIRRDIAS